MAEIVSPKSTGGGGTAFEFKVQASFLGTMLVNGCYPCLPDGKAQFIRFQARQLGYQVDDIFVHLETPSGVVHRLLAQAKVDITFTQSDEEFRQTLIAAWTDFTNTELFNPDKDVIVIISGPGSKKEIRHFRSLLNWSRSSASAEEFFGKVSTPEYASNEKRTYLGTIRRLLKDHLGSEPCPVELWRFMKCLHWVSYDFDESPSHDLVMVQTLLRLGMKAASAISPTEIWGKLLKIVTDYDPAAGSLKREILVDLIGDCFINLRVTDDTGLKRLEEHAEVILSVVQTCLRDGTHLNRKLLLQGLWDFLSERRIILMTGVAGVGKSAAIKEMLDSFAKDIPKFILKADELDRPHLDHSLTAIGVHESIKELSDRFGLLNEKIFIVESLEKLLEADYLDAFHQLLRFLLNDPTWIVVLSSRSHAIGTIRDEILMPQLIFPEIFEIPLLSDLELHELANKYPGLNKLIHNPSIKELLRVPMYLSYACLIDWEQSADSTMKLEVNEFEQVLWEQVIRKEKQQKDGIHLKRERCFIQMAVARAKSMTPFVSTDPFDAVALHSLEMDDLIVRTEEGVAPAHDLFEEWSIDRYIDSRFREFKNDFVRLFDEIGSEPAMRRGFRAWLVGQLVRQDSMKVADFISKVSQSQDLLGFWRDEVIVAVLLSPKAHQYFAIQEDELVKDDLKYLMRVIHLLRTACKEPDTKRYAMLPLTAAGQDFFSTMFLRPSGGGGWDAALDFILSHMELITSSQLPLISGLLQDWVVGLDAANDLPSKARTVGLIAIHLLNLSRETYSDDLRKDILRTAFRVSSVIIEELQALFKETIESAIEEEESMSSFGFITGRTRSNVGKPRPGNFRFYQSIMDAAVESFYCFNLCESMPDDVVALAKKKWIRPRRARRQYQRNPLDRESYFGLERHDYKMLPASALQGPFLFLLKSHPQHGIDLILDIINAVTECFAYSGLESVRGEPIPQVKVKLNDGREIFQYISGRLWGAYRGLSDIPDVLESALMALEKWMLDLAKDEIDLTGYFDQLLSRSNSCAISAVLVSIAIAYPGHLREHLLPLLRTEEFIVFERSRMSAEGSLIVDMGKAMGFPKQGVEELFISEREDAQKMPHRKCDLEWLALNLQTTPLREQIQIVIDEHYENLPPLESQTDEDRTWRLALHRMDLRRYQVEKVVEEDKAMLVQVPPDEDIQEMQARLLPENERRIELGRVTTWARLEFHQGSKTEVSIDNWKKLVEWAQSEYRKLTEEPENDEQQMWLAGPIYIAALSLRDHLAELETEEIAWCSKVLKKKVFDGLNDESGMAIRQTGATDGTAAAAYVLPSILNIVGCDGEELRLAIASCLTHTDNRVRSSTIQGVHRYVWQIHTILAKSFLMGLMEFACLDVFEHREHREVDFGDPSYNEKKEAVKAKYQREKYRIRIAMARSELMLDFDPAKITFEDYSTYYLASVVQMLPVDKEIYDSEPIFTVLIQQTLIAAKEETGTRRSREFEFENVLNKFASFFVLRNDLETAKRICAPMVASIEDSPDYLADFVEELISNSDAALSGAHFWNVWHLFADAAFSPTRLDNKFLRYRDEKLIKTLMLATIPWKSEAKEWKTLSDNPNHLAAACTVACKTEPGFEALLNLFYTIGGSYLPAGFTWLADALAYIDINKLFSNKNNRYALETLLRMEIHQRSIQIRSNPTWQRSVLALLDILVDFGSSVAFQLRERIIRPPKGRQRISKV